MDFCWLLSNRHTLTQTFLQLSHFPHWNVNFYCPCGYIWYPQCKQTHTHTHDYYHKYTCLHLFSPTLDTLNICYSCFTEWIIDKKSWHYPPLNYNHKCSYLLMWICFNWMKNNLITATDVVHPEMPEYCNTHLHLQASIYGNKAWEREKEGVKDTVI